METVPCSGFICEESEGREPEDDRFDFKDELDPVDVKFGEEEGDEYDLCWLLEGEGRRREETNGNTHVGKEEEGPDEYVVAQS